MNNAVLKILVVNDVVPHIKNRTTIAEGYYTTKAIYNLVQTLGIDAPILKSVYDILYNTANPIHEAEAILKRPIKESEFY